MTMMTTDIVLFEGNFTEGELQAFEEKYLAMMEGLANNKIAQKRLQEDEKKAKQALEQVMDEYGIKSIDNRFIRITRVAENKGKPTIDLTKMQKEEPELYAELLEDYPTITGKKKAYLKFDTKG